MDPQAFLGGLSRETRIRRDALGRWWSGDDPITHPNLVRAFDSWIDRAEDGRYCLRNALHWVYVTLEGAPLFVRQVRLAPGPPTLVLSSGREEPLEPRALTSSPAGVLFAEVQGGRFLAQFDRSAMFALEPLLGEDAEGPYLRWGEARVRPPVVADPVEAHDTRLKALSKP